MRSFRFLVLLITSLVIVGCDEELPPQSNPKELFISSITSQYQYTSDARPTQSSIDVYIVYKNFYEETLEDFASLKGTIKIEWVVSPEERGAIIPYRTDVLTVDNLFQAAGYNFSTNRLSIDPGDSVILRYRWNLKTDDSTNLMSQVKYSVDKGCSVNANPQGDPGYRFVSSKQPFLVTASFTIFQRGGIVVTSPQQFTSCWIAPHYGEQSPCNQPNPSNPCSVISTVVQP
ncbi:MAG: hypothetical protein KA247_04110 [Bacteroidetes bacterium]|nr:hypothetical protein [Bacteroidota bacterium]